MSRTVMMLETFRSCIRKALSVLVIVLSIGWTATAMAGPNEELIKAARRGEVATVEALLAKGADVQARDTHGSTALLDATFGGHDAVVEALLARGADVQAKDNHGRTALMWASWNGHLVVVQALLAKGADVQAKSTNGNTALMTASSEGHVAVVQALLAKGADVQAKDNDGRTALMWAKDAEVKAVLVKAGVTPGWTAMVGPNEDLINAAGRGELAIVEALLAKGTDVQARDNHGRTALMLASLNGHLVVVQALLAKGADVQAKSTNGNTALMAASWKGHLAVMQALLAKGADVQAKNIDGRTALMVAKDAEVEALLVKAGATDDAQTAREAAAKREQTARQLTAKREYERQHPKITNEEASTEPSEADSTVSLLMQSLGTVADGMAAMKQQSNAMANRPSAPMLRSAPSSSTASQGLSQTAGSLATSPQMGGNGSSGQGGVTTTHTNNPANFATRCTSVQEDKGLFSFYFHNNCAFPIAVTWCANSKEEPNRCNTRGFDSTELNIPVGGRWPMAEGFRPISWEYLACRKDTLYYSTDMARNKQAICE